MKRVLSIAVYALLSLAVLAAPSSKDGSTHSAKKPSVPKPRPEAAAGATFISSAPHFSVYSDKSSQLPAASDLVVSRFRSAQIQHTQ
jgi:hypothetical protein